MTYILGDRNQKKLFPSVIEDYVGTEDPVRVYDAFVECIDFQEMGFSIRPFKAGAREYHPKSMLKLFIYGYSYGIRSSRKLERACRHNLSFMWLVSGIQPDYRTIARFRHDNKEAIKQVLKQNAKLCIKLGLIEGNTLFLDGSKFRANASINSTWDDEKCKKYMEIAEKNIERIMEEAEQIDKEEDSMGSLVKLNEELKDQKKLQEKVQKISRQLKESGKKKINSTDIDAVNGKGRQGTHAIINCQIITDEKHGLILNSDGVSQNNDYNQFSPQVEQAKETLDKAQVSVVSNASSESHEDTEIPQATQANGTSGKAQINVISDAGYYSLEDIEKTPEDVKVIMPSKRQAQKENKKKR